MKLPHITEFDNGYGVGYRDGIAQGLAERVKLAGEVESLEQRLATMMLIARQG